MKRNYKTKFFVGYMFILFFLVWTALIQIVDVKPFGQNGTEIGFAKLNCWFHNLTGINMILYTITDWLGLIPIFVCILFGGIGVIQLIRRKSLSKVDSDIIFLGVYYIIVILCYVLFEIITINYRPILIEGRMESSYPSSTTLLVLCVMSTLVEQINRRFKNVILKRIMKYVVICFTVFMVIGRVLSGVHWITDIVGGILLSTGLFYIYMAMICNGNLEVR